VERKGLKRNITRLTIAITFVIGVVVFPIWLIYRNPKPPLTVCELLKNPSSYTSKTIRVQGIIFGHDEMGFYAPDCQGGASFIHADFDLESWKTFKSRAKPSGKYYFMGEQEEYLVSAILTGRFEKVKDADCDENGRQLGLYKFPYTIYCYAFIVSDIEQVKATDIKLPG
jgi:hypothetical protein